MTPALRQESGGRKAYSMMVRLRIPGGRITSEQMLAQLDLCDELGNSTMKITTRQTTPVARGPEERSASDDQSNQRDRTFDTGRLRRCQPQHHVLPGQTSRTPFTPRWRN